MAYYKYIYEFKLKDVWTAEKISESYPISVEECKKLLRSKWAPKTLEQIANHDQQVIDNWKDLYRKEKTAPCGPVVNIYKDYIESNKRELANFLKNRKAPLGGETQTKLKLLSDSYSIHESLLCVSSLEFNL